MFGFDADVFGDLDLGFEVFEAGVQLFHGVHLHVAAVGAGAVVGGAGDEVLVGALFLQAMEHAGFGDDDDVLAGCVLAEADHLFGGADFVGKEAHGLGALGMCDDEGVGIFFFDFMNGIARELDVDIARAFPKVHLATGLFNDPLTEVGIGNEKNGAVGGGFLDDESGVAGGADDIAERLHAGRAIDVSDDVVVLVLVLGEVGFQLVGGAGLLERTAGVFVGKDDCFVGIEDLGGLGHEVNSAEGDDVGIGFAGLVGEAQGVAHVVGDVLDGADLVVVGENDGVLFFLETKDVFDEVQCCGHG